MFLGLKDSSQNHFESYQYHEWTKGSRPIAWVNRRALQKKIIPLKELSLLSYKLVSLDKCSETTTRETLEGKVSLTAKNLEQEDAYINQAL